MVIATALLGSAAPAVGSSPGAPTPTAPLAQVLMLDNAFQPRTIEAAVGFGGIHWENQGLRLHTATTTSAPAWLDLLLDEGQSADTQAAYAGTFPIVCIYHPKMVATLRLAPTVAPPGGAVGQAFTITVALDDPSAAGFAVDLQRRRNRGAWADLPQVETAAATFTSKRAGDYRIRARLVDPAAAAHSGWSPAATFSVG
jgi:plastocyanin